MLFTKERVDQAEKITSIIANILIILGLIFALVQIIQVGRIEKRRIAIEAIEKIRTPEYIKAVARLKTITNFVKKEGIKPIPISLTQDRERLETILNSIEIEGIELTNILLIDDINYILNTYDNLAILYINDLVDKQIIENNVCENILEISDTLDFFECPDLTRYRRNFDRFLKIMEKEKCMKIN